MTRLVLISDTHGYHQQLNVPDGDILLHAGDITLHGKLEEVASFNKWLGSLPHPHKLVIAGNHDFCIQKQPAQALPLLKNATYLQDQAAHLAGIRFYGSPWQPWYYNWAFNLQRGAAIRAKWERIPRQTDVLITHGPPYSILDHSLITDQDVGCEDLLEVVQRIQPRLHLFGHIHEDFGILIQGNTTYINASFCGYPDHQQFHEAIVYDLT